MTRRQFLLSLFWQSIALVVLGKYIKRGIDTPGTIQGGLAFPLSFPVVMDSKHRAYLPMVSK